MHRLETSHVVYGDVWLPGETGEIHDALHVRQVDLRDLILSPSPFRVADTREESDLGCG